jgi:hypothetical protein
MNRPIIDNTVYNIANKNGCEKQNTINNTAITIKIIFIALPYVL